MTEQSIVRGALFDGRIATLTLNRPDRKNALGPDDWFSLAVNLDEIRFDTGVRAVLIRGNGGAHFRRAAICAPCPSGWSGHRWCASSCLRRDAQVIRMLYELEQPVVASIEGPCLGAGLALALACDLRIASHFGNLRRGVSSRRTDGGFGLSWLLPRAVGPAQASDLLLTAEVVGGVRARELGLVQRVVEPAHLDEETLKLCRRLADGPPLARRP